MFGRIKRTIMTSKGLINRFFFMRSLQSLIKGIPSTSFPAVMVSMSGRQYFEDQLLSLISFYYNVGIPDAWIIYSDGTYTDAEASILKKFPNLEIRNIVTAGFAKEVSIFPTLRKMYVLKDIKPGGPVLYADSDVLFFKLFSSAIKPFLYGNAYLVDELPGFFDEPPPAGVSADHPLNLGFMVLNTVPDWNLVWDYLNVRIRQGQLQYWSDQTACHIMAVKNNFKPLPAETFVVTGKDSFTLHHAVNYHQIAIRHFVGPVRHKMWQLDLKQILRYVE